MIICSLMQYLLFLNRNQNQKFELWNAELNAQNHEPDLRNTELDVVVGVFVGAIALFRRAILSRATTPSRDAAICIVRAFAITRDNAWSATAIPKTVATATSR